MVLKLNVKRLNRLSWLLAIIIGMIFYIIYYNNGPRGSLYPYTLLSLLSIALIGHVDVLLMVFLGKRFSVKSKEFTLYRTLITYPASMVIYLILWPICAYMARFQNSYWSINLFLAFIGSGVVMNTMVIIMHDSVLLYEHKLSADLEVEQLRRANVEAKFQLLKQQINPHFLFNALNTLKALYNKDTAMADDYIVHMASFLRTSIHHHSSNLSTLAQELAFSKDYLEMQYIRFGNALQCSIILDQHVRETYALPSFSLQPLLENAIKHNNFTKQHPLMIRITQEGGYLVISNNLQKKNLKVPSTQYGLANLAERYRLCSGDEVKIKADDKEFSVSIKLLKNENCNH
ncbi:sensor histidine kinase [Pedobacter sp. N23S346]|uniref:sensor histidine kinase n=1 Tax=Pedobacter sp. N23S346 TaxID=3402750 RepID=UPI003AC78C08